MTTPINEVKVFCSYAREDELLRNELEKHLATLWRAGNISIWHDRKILAGMDWAHEIDVHLNKADVLLLLISPDFMASEYCNGIELKRSLERHKKGEVRVIPIILRPVHWQQSPFGKLQALPTNAQPITVWENQDQAFFDVAQGIITIVEQILSISPTSPPFTQGLDSRDGFSSYPRHKKRSSKVSGGFFFLTIGFLFLLLLGSVGFLYFSGIWPMSNRPPFSPTLTNSATFPNTNTPSSTRQPTPAPPGSQLLYSDSLNSDRGEGWDTSTDSTGSCSFLAGYHVHSQAGSRYHFCAQDKPLYSDFTISVDMNISSNSSGGILLRVSKVNSTYSGYFFEVTAHGRYGFSYFSSSGIYALKTFEFSSAINMGQNSLNTLKVVAAGDKFAFYINGTPMNSPVQDSHYREGFIGFANFNDQVSDGDAVFRNINVYA